MTAAVVGQPQWWDSRSGGTAAVVPLVVPLVVFLVPIVVLIEWDAVIPNWGQLTFKHLVWYVLHVWSQTCGM